MADSGDAGAMSARRRILYPESWTPNFGIDVARTRQPDWYFDFDSAKRLLCDQFEVASLAGFGAEGLKPAIAAAGAPAAVRPGHAIGQIAAFAA